MYLDKWNDLGNPPLIGWYIADCQKNTCASLHFHLIYLIE